ncbi:MAG TPA: nickel resistance protein [Candidatus Accumulibacter sp.]|nr:nickel resistance protein [Accumulibacter sp.]HRF10542.1 metal-sensing transcriptional repressor [Candidatus Accumulibacter phosphatis]
MKEATVHPSHPDIVKRLKRSEGHLRAIVEMIEANRSCVEVVQQLHAVEKAVSAAKKVLVHDHIDHCLEHAFNLATPRASAALSEFKEIAKYL